MHVLRPRCLKDIVAGWLRSREFNADSAISLLARYDLGTPRSVKPLSGESRSDNVLVSTDRGRWMLKEYRASLGVEAITFEHSLLSLREAVQVGLTTERGYDTGALSRSQLAAESTGLPRLDGSVWGGTGDCSAAWGCSAIGWKQLRGRV